MSSVIADLVVRLTADADKVDKELGSVGKRVAGVAKSAFIPATAALGALGVAAKIGFDEFKDAEKVTAQTNAVLKSTGGIANVTAGDVDKLANSLLQKSGVDDEAIKSGANLLLTFTNIRNEVGKGNNIFDQATATVLDMSTALGVDMKSSATLVGKALNDPVKGLTALQRVGVAFTAGQKKQIKTMVESGNTMGAQKLILGELSKEFGGSAAAAGKTFDGQISLVRNNLLNFAAELVASALPALTMLTSGLAKATAFASEHQTATKILVGAIAGLSAAIVAVNVALRVYAVWQAASKAATVAWTAVQWALNAALTANPIGAVIVVLAALVAGIIIAWKKSETFRAIVLGVWATLKTFVIGAVQAIVGAIVTAWTKIQTTTTTIWNAVLGFLRRWWPLLLGIATGGIGLIIALIITKWGVIKTTTITIWNAISGAVKTALNTVSTAVTTVFGAIEATVNRSVGAVRSTVSTTFRSLAGVIRAVAGPVGKAVERVVGAFDPILQVLRDIIGLAGRAVSAIEKIGTVADKIGSVAGKIGGALGKVPGFASGVTNFGGGLALVGERGPELVNLPKGADVISARRTRGLFAQSGEDRGPLIGEVHVHNGSDVETLARRVERNLAFGH